MKAVLNTRNAINLSLVLTLGLGPTLSYLHADDSSSQRPADLVTRALEAKKAGNVQQYQALLRQAKNNLPSEMMTKDSQRQTSHSLDQLIAHPETVKSQPATNDAQADLLRDNPEARSVLFDMAVGRSENASTQMDGLMMTVKGQTGLQYDINNADASTLDLVNPTVDLFAKVLSFFGIKLADLKYDLSLIRRNDPGYNPDTVAENLIRGKAHELAVAAGGASVLGSIVRQQVPNKYLQAAGLTTFGLLMLNIDSVLMQDIAAIYGQPIRDQHELEMFELSVFALAQIMSRATATVINPSSISAATVEATAQQIGANFALSRVKKFAPAANGFFNRILKNSGLTGMIANGKTGAERVANMTGLPADPTVPSPADPTQTTNPNQPAPAPAPAQKVPFRGALQTVVAYGLKAAMDAGTAYALTEAIGHAAIKISRAAARKSQEERDNAFYQFMEGAEGMQFVDLLILAGQASDHPVRDTDFEKSNNPSVLFVRNVAHMGHICSLNDVKAADAVAARIGAKNVPHNIVTYDCAGRSTAAWSIARANFLNFKGIMNNERQMTALRATAISNRLKMAQLVLQYQYLVGGGYRDAKQVDFYDTVRKLLGLDNPNFDSYFQYYDAHVAANHGPQPNAQSPTGFIVLGTGQAAPFSEKKAGIAPSDAEILDSALLQSNGSTTTTNTNTNTSTNQGPNNNSGGAGNGGTWPPQGSLPPTTPVCNPNAGGNCPSGAGQSGQNVPAPGATRSWLHISNLQGA